jgi:single stranded DNA-binding protein
MTHVNRCEIEGNLTADSVLKYTNTGKAVLTFSIANSTFQGKGRDNYTSFFNIVVWGTYAERMAPRLIKGCTVMLTAQARIENYNDNQGNKKQALKFVVGLNDYIRFTYINDEARARHNALKNQQQAPQQQPGQGFQQQPAQQNQVQQGSLFAPPPVPPKTIVSAYSAPAPGGLTAQPPTQSNSQNDQFEDDIPF